MKKLTKQTVKQLNPKELGGVVGGGRRPPTGSYGGTGTETYTC